MTMLPPNPNERTGQYRNSCMNRVTHGLRSANVIPGEDYGELEEINANLRDFYQPLGPDEEYWVHKIVMVWWRSRRTGHLDVQIFTSTAHDRLDCDVLLDPRMHHLQRYQTNMDREMQRATRELDRIQKLRGFNRHAQVTMDDVQPEPPAAPEPAPKPQSGAHAAIQQLPYQKTRQAKPVSGSVTPSEPAAAEPASLFGNVLDPNDEKAA